MARLSLTEQFELLRAQIETARAKPCVLVVTSAQRGDGKTATAFGLAASFANAGYRTCAVDANHVAPSFPELHAPANVAQLAEAGTARYAATAGGYDVLSLANETLRHGASRESTTALFALLRGEYAYTIVDAACALESNVALLAAAGSDATLLAAREGRSVGDADREIVRTFEREAVPFLGALTVSARTIRAFALPVAAQRSAREPRPAVTEIATSRRQAL